MDTNKKKVLIVEDDEHIARIYDIKFAQSGFETSLARDGEEGMAKIIAEKPDLVILDLMLPRKDGFTVLEEMKKNPNVANIPVLVLSNLGGSADIERALALGAKEHLIKVNHSMQEVVDKAKECMETHDHQ
jgi:DNA-binding response OmpR family regulator